MPPSTSIADLATHGWTPVPRSLSTLLSTRPNPVPSTPIPLSALQPLPSTPLSALQPLPSTPLIDMVTTYARTHLSTQTFAHSMRVYYFSLAILHAHFPSWLDEGLSKETLLLTCLLHDIATTDEAMEKTFLSFEFAGGFTALSLLSALHAPQIQSESVAETIIRHQDLGETGCVSRLTIIHFATVLDNAGLNAELVHRSTIEEIVGVWPREGWSGCFAGVVRAEVEGKGWCNTTRIEGFAEMVEGNEVMREWD
ncbi:hypothetical protein PRZ48_000297 [Zasmidium cellare]|uniref:Cyanamide hydratase n=1 Tax=Zasmidium cellare TaxID=395010 RepID=A0ABR0EZT0_ZASCE|nr:hypothetical protein PRZ48_000297 [Zasmidium cellare]